MKAQNSLPRHIIQLIISCETGQASKEEKAALDNYLKSHPGKRAEISGYAEIIRRADIISNMRDINKEAAWDHILQHMEKTPSRSSFPGKFLKYAAVLLPLIIGVGFLYFYLADDSIKEAERHAEVMSAARKSSATLVLSSGESLLLDDHTAGQFFEDEGVKVHQDQSDRIRLAEVSASVMHSLIVPRGGEYQLVLSDGSTVWINSDSQLDYPTLFSEDKRHVTLNGEAYFDVVPDPDRPFVVETPEMEVTVTGTTFNIQNYADDVAEATVVSGSIRVLSGDKEAVDVSSGQQARLSYDTKALEVREVDVRLYTSWIDGMFRFRNMELGELANRMQRWYDVNVDVPEHEVAAIRLTGAMEKERPVEYLVYLIERSAPLNITVKDDTIRIKQAN